MIKRISLSLAIWSILLCVCTVATEGIASSSDAADRITATENGFVLGRPLVDFYDTVFVLTNGGLTLPRVVNIENLAQELLAYDVIFFGETHRHPGVHLQQQRLLRALFARFPGLVLSLEQFERDVQPVLDDYLNGKIGENALIDKGRAWDNYRTSYRPLVQFAKDNKLPVIAAEAPVWTAVCVGQYGPAVLEKFTPEERGFIAVDLHAGESAYRQKYMKFVAGSSTHGNNGDKSQARRRAENSYYGQVLRDDTMAESIQSALKRYPGRKLLHLDGSFHSDGFLGTVERLRLREPSLKIAVISPVEVQDSRLPAFTRDAVTEGTVLQLVYPEPDAFVTGEDQSEWVRKQLSKRASNPCKYIVAPQASGNSPDVGAAK